MLSLGAESQTPDILIMIINLRDLLSCLHVPQTNMRVRRHKTARPTGAESICPHGYEVAVGAKGDRPDLALITGQYVDRFSGVSVPET